MPVGRTGLYKKDVTVMKKNFLYGKYRKYIF